MKSNKKETNETIKVLCERIEDLFKCKIASPSDFSWLSDEIAKHGEHLSPSTLKRIWQYIPNTNTPRNSSLSALARLLGYNDFTHFVSSLAEDEEEGVTCSFRVHGALLPRAWVFLQCEVGVLG